MRIDEDNTRSSGSPQKAEQIGGYSEDAISGVTPDGAAYPGDLNDDFASEHMRPSFSDELSDSPGMQREPESPDGTAGMDEKSF